MLIKRFGKEKQTKNKKEARFIFQESASTENRDKTPRKLTGERTEGCDFFLRAGGKTVRPKKTMFPSRGWLGGDGFYHGEGHR